MGAIYVYGPIYTVCAYMEDHGEFGYDNFKGERALSEASDHFGRLKCRPDAYEIWMTRLDGDEWVFVERIRRDSEGKWQRIDASI